MLKTLRIKYIINTEVPYWLFIYFGSNECTEDGTYLKKKYYLWVKFM